MSRLLELQGVHAFYGKSHILRGVDLQVAPGEIVSLLGRNGAGRSTLLKAVMGLVETSGEIRFGSENIQGLQPFQVARKGVGYVPENRDIFPILTVEQNLVLGQKPGNERHEGKSWTLDDMYRMFPRLQERASMQAGVLSGGEQQMLALSRTMMGNPRLVLVDEPAEGLAPQIVELVAQFLLALQRQGVAVLLVEQKLAIALEISQRVYVLGHGSVVFEGSPADLRANEAVRREWLEV
ncbi:amino acid/amide ABC transporter ATP-binding protein 2 (HAAT family) [Paucimonas lemoignei]|uniref:Amino acid/amide ABC transporter ATP-binding protein 2 (HAAT family) n=1 Tax=Paucimonas lemoignei TaxID=29443 RepID=A0A4R3I2K8_PAULE|nr:ABC transporter ATP-binding protein [Paucimonas lemoignei]TCS39253.1 amino acid/amide ABC transporter ATP-binding protein 2 (HAAT family) [Paucimonas lemoignei]